MTPVQLAQRHLRGEQARFDAVIAMSRCAGRRGTGSALPMYNGPRHLRSFDHDGLGRYGDPLVPDADLRMLRERLSCAVRPDALLYLSVPVGPDCIVWNLHRRYGRVRLPHLLAGWRIVDVFGWNASMLDDRRIPEHRAYEPVWVLQMPTAAAPSSDAPMPHREL